MQIIRIGCDVFKMWSNQIESLLIRSVQINFPKVESGETYGKNKCREVAEFLKDGSAVVFAAIHDNELVGWVWCHEIHRLCEKRIHIAEIAVAEKWNRQGVGSRLLERVEQYAEENGYQSIDLLVTANNMVAVKFYKKANFEPERYLMKKTIKKVIQTGKNVDA